MNREQFYELLDIESAEDFQYFENLAAFFECEEELDYEDVAALFGAVDQAVLAELIDEYFEEITNFVPGSETEVFSIFENVRRALVGLCRNCEEDETLRSKLMRNWNVFAGGIPSTAALTVRTRRRLQKKKKPCATRCCSRGWKSWMAAAISTIFRSACTTRWTSTSYRSAIWQPQRTRKQRLRWLRRTRQQRKKPRSLTGDRKCKTSAKRLRT